MEETVAIIPARGGSTRIPRKNVLELNGKPMIAWPITEALSSGAFARVVVSTDDDEIASIAARYGAEVPFRRPAELANNLAPTTPVIQHAVTTLGLSPEVFVACIYPTALLSSFLLGQAVARFASDPDRFLVTVGRHRSPLERAVTVGGDGHGRFEQPEFLGVRTQDLPTRYFDAGKIYIARARDWLASENMMEKPFATFELPDWASIDIDEPADLEVAEVLHSVFGPKSS